MKERKKEGVLGICVVDRYKNVRAKNILLIQGPSARSTRVLLKRLFSDNGYENFFGSGGLRAFGGGWFRFGRGFCGLFFFLLFMG